MKGVIAICLGELINEKFGRDKWEEVLKGAGLPGETFFLATEDVDDAVIMKVVAAVCKVTGMSMTEAADAFGEYWFNVYAPRIYKVYYAGKNSAKEMLLALNHIHKSVATHSPNARPPRFEYEWKDERTLIMTYQSRRGLIDFFIGILKGVGKYYGEKLSITRLPDERVEIRFLGQGGFFSSGR